MKGGGGKTSIRHIGLTRDHVVAGMSASNFKDIPQLQEVECWPGNLEADMKLLSLSLYRVRDESVLALLNVLTNSCLTHGEFSSCTLDTSEPRKSKVRVLVADLEEGESRTFGCDVKAFTSRGESTKTSTSLVVTRHSELSALVRYTILYTLYFFSGSHVRFSSYSGEE